MKALLVALTTTELAAASNWFPGSKAGMLITSYVTGKRKADRVNSIQQVA